MELLEHVVIELKKKLILIRICTCEYMKMTMIVINLSNYYCMGRTERSNNVFEVTH